MYRILGVNINHIGKLFVFFVRSKIDQKKLIFQYLVNAVCYLTQIERTMKAIDQSEVSITSIYRK